MKNTIRNTILMYVFTIILGAFAGLVIWCFLKAVGIGTAFIWDTVPEMSGFKYMPLILCTAGGLIAGLLHRKYGDHPEELSVVMGKIEKDKYYSYENMPAKLLSAFIPLIFGASVGPEAGLTGIIAALCYWVGDNVTYAKKNSAVFSEIGEAVTLGQLFRSPLFGILVVEENGKDEEGEKPSISRSAKFLYYGLSTAAGIFIIAVLNKFLGNAMEGFPSFDEVTIASVDYALIFLYIPVGCILCLFFEGVEGCLKKISAKVPVIIKEMICGLSIGIISLFVPVVLFSGEEQMAELMKEPGKYVPLILIALSLLKMIMTCFSISFGMKGGHFFPVIFACTLMGYGLSGLIFADPSSHVVFAAGIVTAAMLGAQLKKPLTVAVLLLLCFPVRFIFWLFLSAAAGGNIISMLRIGKDHV
ncbi:MAG: chloride channel protein [Lachnospiraceae bacterium]|nr:chloride channel protein [Lachnospiraceae bacterium]